MLHDHVPADDGACYYGMGWMYSTEMFSQPMFWHAGLVENYISNMFLLPEKGIGVVVLVNMNDYLVNNMLLENIVNPLIGEKQEARPNLYLILHLLIKALYLLLSIMSVHSLLGIKRWKKEGKKETYC